MKKPFVLFVLIVFIFVFSCFSMYRYFPFVACKIYEYKSFAKYNLEIKKIKVKEEIFTYAEGGNKEKGLLIFVHGFQADKRFWLHYLDRFISNYHIIIPDLPAHGGSTFQALQKFDLRSLAQTFNDFILAKGVKQFSLVGTSLGGGVILEYAAAYPEKIQNLILINPIGIRPDNEKDYSELVARNEEIFFPNNLKELDNLYVYLMGRPFPAPIPFKRYFLNFLLEKRAIYKKVFIDLVKGDGVEQILPKINVPTLLLVGQEDKVSSIDDFNAYSKNIPNCKSCLISNGYHILEGKAFEEAISKMQTFLNSSSQ